MLEDLVHYLFEPRRQVLLCYISPLYSKMMDDAEVNETTAIALATLHHNFNISAFSQGGFVAEVLLL